MCSDFVLQPPNRSNHNIISASPAVLFHLSATIHLSSPPTPPLHLSLLFWLLWFSQQSLSFQQKWHGRQVKHTHTNDSSWILLQSATVCVCVEEEQQETHLWKTTPRAYEHTQLIGLCCWCCYDAFPPSSLHLLQFVSFSSQSKPRLC